MQRMICFKTQLSSISLIKVMISLFCERVTSSCSVFELSLAFLTLWLHYTSYVVFCLLSYVLNYVRGTVRYLLMFTMYVVFALCYNYIAKWSSRSIRFLSICAFIESLFKEGVSLCQIVKIKLLTIWSMLKRI